MGLTGCWCPLRRFREHSAHFGSPGLPKATHDTLPGARHRGVGDASSISEQQLVEKLSGIV